MASYYLLQVLVKMFFKFMIIYQFISYIIQLKSLQYLYIWVRPKNFM